MPLVFPDWLGELPRGVFCAVEQLSSGLDLEGGAVDQQGDEGVLFVGSEGAQRVQFAEQRFAFAADDRS